MKVGITALSPCQQQDPMFPSGFFVEKVFQGSGWHHSNTFSVPTHSPTASRICPPACPPTHQLSGSDSALTPQL